MKSAFQRDPGDPVTCKTPHDLGHVVPGDLGKRNGMSCEVLD